MNNYINDAFTLDGNNTNLEVDNLNVSCITSKNNEFELDSNGNLTVNSVTTRTGTNIPNFNNIYPIGSIYLTVNSTNPSTLFGGVWLQVKDRFLLGCGDIYANGTTGGESEHQLTVDEMPSHNHSNWFRWMHDGEVQGTWAYSIMTGRVLQSVGDTNAYSGGDHPHNNMPPYISVYIWERIG